MIGPRLPVPARAFNDGSLSEAARAQLLGEPVIAVQTGTEPISRGRQSAGESVADRVDALAAAFSAPRRPLAPLRVRGAWVIAPQQRDRIITDFRGVDPLDAMGGQTLWAEAVCLLSPDQVAAMAGPDGISFSELPDAARERVRRAVALLQRWEEAPEGGRRREPLAPLDPETLRFQVVLRAFPGALSLERQVGDTTLPLPVFLPDQPAFPAPRLEGDAAQDIVRLPDVRREPNTLKPSDLDTSRLRAPFGWQGVYPVSAVLERAGSASSLRFRASPQYNDARVFIGSDALSVGEVLDGMRLALTATFRRWDGFYLLTYDREGLGSVSERVRENGADLATSVTERFENTSRSTVWGEIARRANFLPDDPWALTEKQRAALYAGAEPGDPLISLRWNDLSPEQQSAVRASLVGKPITLPMPGGGRPERRPGAESDLPSVVLDGRLAVLFRAFLPGSGWVGLPASWSRNLDPDGVRAMDRQGRWNRPGNVSEPRPSALLEQRSQPTLLAARARAIVAPPLKAGEIEPLARLMSARGFDTLLYPLLLDGKATIPSEAFPVHPALARGGGLAAVTSEMQRHGIRVEGILDTLAWRRPGEPRHWLSKHPGWLERDILGRPFTEAVHAFARAEIGPAGPDTLVTVRGDLVRADEPAVASNLETLVREAADIPRLTGLLFDAWTPDAAVNAETLLPLRWEAMTGFATTDRRAAIKAEGADPVDRPLTGETAMHLMDVLAVPPSPRSEVPRFVQGRYLPPEPPPDAHRILLERLVAIRPPDPRPWATYAVRPAATSRGWPYAMEEAPLPVDVALAGPFPAYRPREATGEARMFRVRPRGDGEKSAPAMIAAEGRLPAHMSMPPPLALAVYDFRDAPGELLDSLRRVGLPEPVVETARPAAPAAPPLGQRRPAVR